jgi:hypothetical protein
MIGISLVVKIITKHIFVLYVYYLLVCQPHYCLVFVAGFPYYKLCILYSDFRIQMESVVVSIGSCGYRYYLIVVVSMISLWAFIVMLSVTLWS